MSKHKNKSQLSPLDRFWRLLKPDSKEIKNVYTYAIFIGIINLSLPLGIQAIINLIQGGKLNTSWIILTLLVSFGVGLNGVLQLYQLRIVENLQQKIFARAAFEFAYRIPRIKMEELFRHYAPELMNRFFDIITIQKGLSKILIDFSAATLQIFFGLLLLSLYHPFFILFSLSLLIILYVMFRLTAKRGLRASLRESKSKYQTVHWLEELARTNTTFKLSGKTDLPLHRTDQDVSEYLKARESHFTIILSQFSMMIVFKVLMVLGLLGIGGMLVMEQLMNIGQFVAAEIIIIMIMNAMEKLLISVETVYDVLTGLEKVGEVTDMELDDRQGLNIGEEYPNKGMKVDLANLSFTYRDGNRPVLKNLNASIKAGTLVALVGKNGAGKSTLIRLLTGLYDLSEGQLMFENIGKESYSAESLRSAIGDCLSLEQLFKGSIMENITMGKAISMEEIKRTCSALHLDTFINRLPKGFNSQIDPQGSTLPESTVQKLLIARAILNAPKLLLIEDNLDVIDQEEIKDIIDFIKTNPNKCTIISATKHDYLIEKADQVIELSEGTISFDGSAEEYKKRGNA
jgi:ABC-type bacteriocin/lantibiotic exporter with double-glycine peptidase domain